MGRRPATGWRLVYHDRDAPRFERSNGVQRAPGISGDGHNNRGRPRDDAVAAGITINGLPIVNDRPNPWGGRPPAGLDLCYEERVIGGPGAFMIVAEDCTSFASDFLQAPARNRGRDGVCWDIGGRAVATGARLPVR